jgi:hypothetical protein
MEQLWCKQLAPQRFQICCIPFFLYDLSIGDEVETDSEYILSTIVGRSGHVTFRAWFGGATGAARANTATREALLMALNTVRAGIETYSENLWAIDANDNEHAVRVADILQQFEGSGRLMYETGDLTDRARRSSPFRS